MTEAEKAYQAARRAIEDLALTGETELDLSGEKFRALERIPTEVGGIYWLSTAKLHKTRISNLTPLENLTKLQALTLHSTLIADVSPLSKLLELRTLTLDVTQVSDLAPLEGLREMRTLGFNITKVRDLSPLTGSTMLSNLSLFGTQVKDLRPICGLTALGTKRGTGVEFSSTPATKADPELLRLSRIGNARDRARETLAYLNTLPPWPEPYLPKARPDGNPPEWIGLRDGDRPPLSPSPIPGRGLVPPAGLRRLTLSDARALLETGHPILRDRCQRVVADIDEALALQAIRIPNDPAQLAAHETLSRTLVLCKAALIGIHDAIPEDLSDQPIDDAAAGRLRAAFDTALESLKEAARYIDRKDHTPTYGGLLRLGAATGVASIMAMAPGVTLAVALPTVYACLYGPEAAKALKEFGKLGGS
ncbi:leucine-rich repeat domain-containing protein [Rhodobacter capsulatus]|uniref:leucine-rich repeat domain-containing protein n=1 Tax=Rhodobacter capsulatus TaxID=1061 RepID=UPI0040276E8E